MGRIGAPWGVKGWVKLFSFADPPDNLLDYHCYWTHGKAGLQQVEFEEIKTHGNGFVGLIKGCDVREMASSYTGLELLLEKSELPGLDAGYYWHQLEGLRVVTLTGHDLGVVQYLMETGANDVLVIKGDAQSVDRAERLLPYIRDKVVREVDLANGLMRVDWNAEWVND